MTTEATGTVRLHRVLRASPSKVYRAFLEPAAMTKWLPPYGFTANVEHMDARVGGTFRIVMVTPQAEMLHSGTYREIERPHRLVFTWTSAATQHRDSVVTVTFEPRADTTMVEIHQVGLPDEGAQSGHRSGWTDALAALAELAV